MCWGALLLSVSVLGVWMRECGRGRLRRAAEGCKVEADAFYAITNGILAGSMQRSPRCQALVAGVLPRRKT